MGVEKHVPSAWNIERPFIIGIFGAHRRNIPPTGGGQKLGLAAGILEPRNAPCPGVTLEPLKKVGVDVAGEDPATVLIEDALLRRSIVHPLVRPSLGFEPIEVLEPW